MKDKPGIKHVVTVLQQELSDRFDKALHPSCALFEPIYVEATFLDPRYKIVLSASQLFSVLLK